MAIKFLNTVQVDTDVLYVDAANDRVGIGTPSPQAKLDVTGDTFLTSRHVKISSNGANVYFTAATHDASGTEGLLNKLSFKSLGTYFDNNFISITDTSVALPLDTSIVQEAISAGDNSWNVLTLPKESGTFALENWVTSNFAPSTGGNYLPLSAGSGSPLTGNLYIENGAPKIYLKDTTDDDDQAIYFQNNAATIEYIISTQDFTGASLGDGMFIGSVSNDELALVTSNTTALYIDTLQKVGIGVTSPQSKLQVAGGIQMADDTATASATKVGTLKYRVSGNNSYVDMCMQTGATTYAWINIVQNNW